VLHSKFFCANFISVNEEFAALSLNKSSEPGSKTMAATKNGSFINTKELGRAIKRKREEMGLSLRDVATETQVSASTLSRIENGTGKPDADNIARLTTWLNMPVDRVMKRNGGNDGAAEPVIYYPHESTPSIIEAHLRADRNLTPDTARALAEMFRVAYTQFSKPGEE
jgi:transcriptional regulator with XRE-family HTH domain